MTSNAGDLDYESLLRFRIALRRFNRWSEGQAQAVGLTHAQHQLLLSVKGHPDPAGPTVGEVADYLLIRHNSTVELIDRTEALGFIVRRTDDADRRVVRLALTTKGAQAIRGLTAAHLHELAALAPLLNELNPDASGRPRRVS
ncbi:MAG TPA: MarR family transcriptional regulator [Mycobacteriales bacterium]|nr:MarR family transcriptional regulator [Mycobacteriales bacterium]